MRFLSVAKTLRNLSVLDKLQEEGHEVAVLTTANPREGYTAFSEAKAALDWNPDICLFLEAGMGRIAESISQLGFPVFNGGIYHETLYSDIDYASVLASRVKIPILPIDNGGVHLHLAGFYSSKAFVGPALSYSVETGLLPSSSKTEAILLHAVPNESPVVQETFYKLEKLFTALKFCGIVFLDVQVDPETKAPHIHRMSVDVPDGFWPTFLGGITKEAGSLLKGLATGRKFNYVFTEDVCGSVKATLPPYPHTELPSESEEEAAIIRKAIHSLSAGKHVHVSPGVDVSLLDVETREGQYVTTGPEVAYITATGTLSDLSYVLGTAIDGLGLAEIQYKSSLGKELATSLAYFEDYQAL